jgi:cytochrome c peroxidase
VSVLTAGVCLYATASPPLTPAGGQESAVALLGKQIFLDTSLSASGRMACATCHDPAHAYGPPNGLAVQRGGSDLQQQGMRAVPSLRYVLNRTPLWNKPFNENRAEVLREGEQPPAGGFGWDGRFRTLHEQGGFPLLSENEMANAGPEDVAAKLQKAAYAEEFRKVFGSEIFKDPARAYAQALVALERFQLEDASFHPYSSKFDDYLEGKAELSAQEQRGKALFEDTQRGNCATCHVDRKGADGSHPLFTDYQFEALGVPRNEEIVANRSSGYYDMGVCGPLRADQARQRGLCGLFKTPTLRNVAARAVFFHNGRFHTLKDALRFYVRRDTDPDQWYATGGTTVKFNDLPESLRGNIDVMDEPLTRKAGEKPAWSDEEIEDVVAFLKTLTDRDVTVVVSK